MRNEPFQVRKYIKDGLLFLETDEDGSYLPIREGIKGCNHENHMYIKSGQVDSDQNMNGIGRVIFQNMIHSGQFKENKMHGFGRCIYKDGRCHIGYYKDDERNGYGKKIYSSGNIYYGYFKDGKRNGYGKFVFKNGNTEEGYSIDDKLTGFAKVIENGNIT